MKTIVLHHSADDDGKFSLEVAKFFLGPPKPGPVDFLGWDYGDPIPDVWAYKTIFMIDIGIREILNEPVLRSHTVLIDHHKSTIEIYQPLKDSFAGWYCIDGVAACRLAWQWFKAPGPGSLPTLEDFLSGTVQEPDVLKFAGLWDVWDHRDPRSVNAHYGLLTLDKPGFDALVKEEFTGHSGALLERVLYRGTIARASLASADAAAAKGNAHTMKWEGLTWCVLNTAARGSQQFASVIQPEHDALLKWCCNGRMVDVSLYANDSNPSDIDLSAIARKYGGGGHRTACGFKAHLTWAQIFYSADNERVEVVA